MGGVAFWILVVLIEQGYFFFVEERAGGPWWAYGVGFEWIGGNEVIASGTVYVGFDGFKEAPYGKWIVAALVQVAGHIVEEGGV